MPKLTAFATAALTLFAVAATVLPPAPAKADTTINAATVTWYATHGDNNTVDVKTCVIFQVNSASTKYAIPYADASFDSEFTTLVLAYLTGQPLTFTYSTTTNGCNSGGTNYNWAYGLYLGTLN